MRELNKMLSVRLVTFAVVATGCSQTKFQSHGPNVAAPTPLPQTATSPLPTTGTPVGGNQVPVTPVDQECRQEAYNPEQFLCGISISESRSVWSGVPGFALPASKVPDRIAEWISPLATVEKPGSIECPNLPKAESIVYVSNFKLTSPSALRVSFLADNAGKVRIWKNGDPAQETIVPSIVNGAVPPTLENSLAYVDTSVLSEGNYSVVADATETGDVPSPTALVLSIANISSGAVILRTSKNESGTGRACLFRFPVGTDYTSRIPAIAKCRKCFTGE